MVKGVVLDSFLIDEIDGVDVNELQVGKSCGFRVFWFVKASVVMTVHIADDAVIELLIVLHITFFPFEAECFDGRCNTDTLFVEVNVVVDAGLVCGLAEPWGVVEFPCARESTDRRVRCKFPIVYYVDEVFLDLVIPDILIEAFALDEADVIIFYGDEIYSFVLKVGGCPAIEDDMSFCFQ